MNLGTGAAYVRHVTLPLTNSVTKGFAQQLEQVANSHNEQEAMSQKLSTFRSICEKWHVRGLLLVEEDALDALVPMAKEEIIHVSEVFPQELVQHRSVEGNFDLHVPTTREESVQVPKTNPQSRDQLQTK
eukprot:TRINITY_DN32797_c0_g1_i1.p1 TRINITY_DN32797_c0_g1~~TRINITY_DN32797_c0_g1_i1.p1  ORF type:complete len:130 (+),score=25.30 TRINITY_DN32797_c0_g1_i1:202-591(+)